MNLMTAQSREDRRSGALNWTKRFRLGEVIVDPLSRTITRDARSVVVEPRVMDLLVYFGQRPLQIVGKRELIENVWKAHVVDEAIHRAISLLRAALGDQSKRPSIIETVPRQGYRLLISPVSIADAKEQRRVSRWWFVGLAMLAIGAAAFLMLSAIMRDTSPPPHRPFAQAPPGPQPRRPQGDTRPEPIAARARPANDQRIARPAESGMPAVAPMAPGFTSDSSETPPAAAPAPQAPPRDEDTLG